MWLGLPWGSCILGLALLFLRQHLQMLGLLQIDL